MDIEKLEPILLSKKFSDLSPKEKEFILTEVGTEHDYEHLRETFIRVKNTFQSEMTSINSNPAEFKSALMNRFETSKAQKISFLDRIFDHISNQFKVYGVTAGIAVALIIFFVLRNPIPNKDFHQIVKLEEIKNPNQSNETPIQNEISQMSENQNNKIITNSESADGEFAKVNDNIVKSTPEQPMVQSSVHSGSIATGNAAMAEENGAIPTELEEQKKSRLDEISVNRNRAENNEIQTTKSESAANEKSDLNDISKSKSKVDKDNKNTYAPKPEKSPSVSTSALTPASYSDADKKEISSSKYPVFKVCSNIRDQQKAENCFIATIQNHLKQNLSGKKNAETTSTIQIEVSLNLAEDGSIEKIDIITPMKDSERNRLIKTLQTLPKFEKPAEYMKNYTYRFSVNVPQAY